MLILLLSHYPTVAAACPHCYGASNDRVFDTYYLSTVMLSLLPFAIVGAIAAAGVLLRRQVRTAHDDGG